MSCGEQTHSPNIRSETFLKHDAVKRQNDRGDVRLQAEDVVRLHRERFPVAEETWSRLARGRMFLRVRNARTLSWKWNRFRALSFR